MAALADGDAVEAAEAEEAGLAAELVHHTLLDDLVFALQSVFGRTGRQQVEVGRFCKEKKFLLFLLFQFPCAYGAVFAAHAASRQRRHWLCLLHLTLGFR